MLKSKMRAEKVARKVSKWYAEPWRFLYHLILVVKDR